MHTEETNCCFLGKPVVPFVKTALLRMSSLVEMNVKVIVLMLVFIAARAQTEDEKRIAEGMRSKYNILVEGYLLDFVNLPSEHPEFRDDAETIKTVGDLMIQSWISMLRPEISMLKEVMDVEEKDDLSTIKRRIVKELKEKDQTSSVSDIVLHFVKTVKPKIENISSDKEELKMIEIATDMALQSYVINFINTFEITSTDKKDSMTFHMPPLTPDSFEQFLEDDENDDDDDDDDGYDDDESVELDEDNKMENSPSHNSITKVDSDHQESTATAGC